VATAELLHVWRYDYVHCRTDYGKAFKFIIEEWRNHYNNKRPHIALGYRPPAPEAIIPMDQRPTMH